MWVCEFEFVVKQQKKKKKSENSSPCTCIHFNGTFGNIGFHSAVDPHIHSVVDSIV